MTSMRAKFQIGKIEKFTSSEIIHFNAVCPPAFDKDGLSEDSTFSKFPPTASASIHITNPSLIDQFKVGDKYCVDFTLAPQ